MQSYNMLQTTKPDPDEKLSRIYYYKLQYIGTFVVCSDREELLRSIFILYYIHIFYR